MVTPIAVRQYIEIAPRQVGRLVLQVQQGESGFSGSTLDAGMLGRGEGDFLGERATTAFPVGLACCQGSLQVSCCSS